MAVAVFKPSVRATLNGRPIHPDFLVAAEPGSEGEFVVEPGYESASFLFPPEDLAEHLRRRGRETEFRAPHGIEFWHAGDLAVRGLFDLGKGLSKTGARTPALFDEHEQARLAAHVEVFDKLVTTLGLIEDKQPTQRDRTSMSYSKIVQAAEDHALEHVSQRMYVTELCEVTRVSERTLQTA